MYRKELRLFKERVEASEDSYREMASKRFLVLEQWSRVERNCASGVSFCFFRRRFMVVAWWRRNVAAETSREKP